MFYVLIFVLSNSYRINNNNTNTNRNNHPNRKDIILNAILLFSPVQYYIAEASMVDVRM